MLSYELHLPVLGHKNLKLNMKRHNGSSKESCDTHMMQTIHPKHNLSNCCINKIDHNDI